MKISKDMVLSAITKEMEEVKSSYKSDTDSVASNIRKDNVGAYSAFQYAIRQAKLEALSDFYDTVFTDFDED